MVEFLTENTHRAYPLEHEWPTTVTEHWVGVLMDACIGCTAVLTESQRIQLISVSKQNGSGGDIVFRIGISDSDALDVSVPPSRERIHSVYAQNTKYKIFLTVNGPVLAAAAESLTATVTVNIPFALRCVSCANRRVTGISAYAPPECTKPVFDINTCEPVLSRTNNDIVLEAKDGVDLEVTTLLPLTGNILRVSAISAPADTVDTGDTIDLMIRGDDCFTVENIPGVDANMDPLPDPKSGGVIRIGNSCKPCCQCEDYENAVITLRPVELDTQRIHEALNTAVEQYNAAVAEFNAIKELVEQVVNSYTNVFVHATAVTSGGVYSGAVEATGTRARMSVNATIRNGTQKQALVAEPAINIPGFTQISVHWSTSKGAGTTLSGMNWMLAPGETLALFAIYTPEEYTASNDIDKPEGMYITFPVRLGSDTEPVNRGADIT